MFVEQKASILCPICGIKFIPNQSNICQACTLSSLDNEKVLSPNEEQLYCIYCFRYQRPPWINCDRESAQLLGILLKKVKGLGKSQIKNAKFVWTQPHSKRIKVKIDFVRVVNETTKVQQSQVVEFIQKYSQCTDCRRNFTPHDWNTCIQIRQHASHQRTLLSLEQNLNRQKWTEKALRVEPVEGGFDIFYKNQQDAHGCLNYIKSHLPISYKISSQLISSNERDNTSNVKTTHALIIPKICKDDLLLMHPKFCKQLGNCSPLLLCIKVASQLYFLDPTNNRKLVITPSTFFTLEPYSDIYSLKHQARNYIVLDNQGKRGEETHNQLGTWGLVIALAEEMKEIFLKSHIDAEVGQEFVGFCLEEWAYIKNLPAHLLVKKVRTEQQLSKKKAKKDEKRKKVRQEKKKEKIERESRQASQLGQQVDEQQNKEEGLIEGDGDWIDLSDQDEV